MKLFYFEEIYDTIILEEVFKIMKLRDIKEIGFYKEVDSEDIWEAYENKDKSEYWRKGEPILLDWWKFTGVDLDDRKTYEVDGLVFHIKSDFPEKEVERIEQKYVRFGQHGESLIEDSPTYRERYKDLLEKYFRLLDLYEKKCDEFKEYKEVNKATGICETCTDVALQENDKLIKENKELKDRLEKLNGD